MNPLTINNNSFKNQLLNGRRDLLWNVSQPGDPYDIRKSMIAKMPGDKKIFMGEHLQLICLLQAAQIQRLCQFLDDYKLRFRQIERSDLDRHSYQIQIKQLTQRLAQQQSSKTQNSKLVDFIKRQQQEIQILRNTHRDSSSSTQGIRQTYQRSLELTNQLTLQNKQLKERIQELRQQYLILNGRYQALQKAKNRQLEEAKLNFSQTSRQSYEKSVNSLRLQFEADQRKIEYQIKRLKQLNEAKNVEISDLQRQREELLGRVNSSVSQNNSDLNRQICQYQNKFVLFGQEIQRLNIALRDYLNKLDESQNRNKELIKINERTDFQKKEIQVRFRVSMAEVTRLNQLIKRYEIELNKMDLQQISQKYQENIGELTNKLRYQSELTRTSKQQIQRLTYQNSKVRVLEKENSDLRIQMNQMTLYKTKLVQTENRVALLSQQLQRLRLILQQKEADYHKSIIGENEAIKSKLKETQTSLVYKYESQISRIKTEYDQRLEIITKATGSQLQTKSRFYQSEFQKIRQQLRARNDEFERQRARIYEFQTQTTRLETESAAKIKNYQYNIITLKRDLQELLNKNKILGQSERRNLELQSKITQIERQINYLNQNLRAKDQELSNLKSKVKQNQYSHQKYQADIVIKLKTYQQTIFSLKTQNEELRRKLNELYNQSNKKLLQTSNQIQRLAINLRQINQENDYLKQNIQRVSIERDQFLRKIEELQAKFSAIQSDTNLQLRNTVQQNDSLKRQINEYKSTISRYQVEISRLSGNMEQTLTNLGRQNDSLKSKISTYESKLTLLSQEFERLNLLLRNKNDQFTQMEIKYKTQNNQYQSLRRQYSQFQLYRNRVQLQVNQKYNSYQQALQQSRKETEDIRKKYSQLERNYFSQKQTWKVKFTQQENGINENTNKITVYENNVLNLTRINQEMQRKLAEIDIVLRQKTQDFNRLESILKNASLENENLKRQLKQNQNNLIQQYEAEFNRRQALYQQNFSQVRAENQQLKRKYLQIGGDSSRRLSEYQLNLRQSTQQNESLKRKVESYQTSVANYQGQVKRRFAAFEQNLSNLGRQNDELKRKLQQLGQLNRKITQYQNKIAILSQEIERLQTIIKSSSQQYENLKRQLYQKQSERNHYQDEVSKVIAVYQQNTLSVSQDHKRIKAEYEQRLIALSKQLERVNGAIRIKTDENLRLDQTLKSILNESQSNKKKIYQLQTLISTKYEVELSKKLSNYEQSIAQLTHQNEEFSRKLRDGADWSRKYSQLQNRIAITNQQLQRLTQGLKSKQQELNKLDLICRSQAQQLQGQRRKLSDLETKYAKNYELQVTKINRGYEENFISLRNKISEYEFKLQGTTQEIERLNNVLRLKVQESIQHNNRLNSLNAQLQDTKRRLRDSEVSANQNSNLLRKQNQQLVRQLQDLGFNIRQNQQSNQHKFASYQNKCKVQALEIERLGQLIKGRTEELEKQRRQFKQYQESLSLQIKGNYIKYQTKLNQLRRENEESKRVINDMKPKVIEYQNKLVLASQEMERLSSLIRTKSDEIKSFSRENQNLRIKMQEFNEFNRKVAQYQFRIGQIIQQNQKLQTALKAKTDDLANTDSKSRQRQQDNQGLKKQLREYQFEFGRKVSSYQQGLTQIKRDNQDLNRKKTQFESKIAIITQQLERVNSQLRIKSEQVLKVSQQFQAYRRSKITEFEGQYTILKQNYALVCGEYQTAKKHLLSYQQSLAKLSSQFQRLHGIINHVNGQKQSLIQKNRILSEQIKRLNFQNKDLDEQTRDIRLRLTDETALQRRINEHLGLMVLLFAEIETLRNRVKAKEQQVVQVRKSSLAPHIVI